ncbi:Uncharacterised protein [Vibrio cholerae]|nr:Uncharacterised protein [Vibrio cholerae]
MCSENRSAPFSASQAGTFRTVCRWRSRWASSGVVSVGAIFRLLILSVF